MNKRIIVIGGGTFNHIRNHLSLAAPAFGTTAKLIYSLLDGSELKLTKMANQYSPIITNEDLTIFIDALLLDKNVGTIILTSAVCDFEVPTLDGIESNDKSDRLISSNGPKDLRMFPSNKIISRIRHKRPDIFLVGFKTTANKSSEEQFLISLKFMKSSKCNLVLANDVVTRNNMIITPEESAYGETTDRGKVLTDLCEIIKLRQNLTYHRTKLVKSYNIALAQTPESFQQVVKFLVNNGGFIENNGNDFTPGHFCWKTVNNEFVSSQRKADHNKVFEVGMSTVIKKTDGTIEVLGSAKASVGATSQRMIFNQYPDFDCIVHTHNPLKESSNVNVVDQRPYQCGSEECGINTLKGLRLEKDQLMATYLNKHGIVIVFNSSIDPLIVLKFIKDNVKLGVKVK